MKNWLEKQFRLSEFNTNIKTELLAGLTTFVTMAYVLATIPNILAGAGYDKHTTLTAMIILIIVTSCAMALVTNRPFALAPGLGSVGIIASMITNGKNLTFKTGGVDGCDCEEILKLISEGKINTEPLITHTYPLNRIEEAYELFENKRDGVIKVAVEC